MSFLKIYICHINRIKYNLKRLSPTNVNVTILLFWLCDVENFKQTPVVSRDSSYHWVLCEMSCNIPLLLFSPTATHSNHCFSKIPEKTTYSVQEFVMFINTYSCELTEKASVRWCTWTRKLNNYALKCRRKNVRLFWQDTNTCKFYRTISSSYLMLSCIKTPDTMDHNSESTARKVIRAVRR